MTAPILDGETFAPFFSTASTRVDLGDSRLVSFDDIHHAVLVISGAVDLFAVELVDGSPRGRWTFLNRVTRGAILVGTPAGPRHRVVGRPVLGSSLARIPAAQFEELSGRTARAAGDLDRAVEQLVSGIEQGILALAGALRSALPPREFVALSARGRTVVPDGQVARSVDGVQWVMVEEGAVELADGVAARISAGTDICVTERDWLVADGRAHLRARSARQLLDDGELWERWVTHAARLLYVIDRRVERQRALERETLKARRQRDQETTSTVRRSFDAVVHDTQSRIRVADVLTDSPVLAAARLVASHDGFGMKAPLPGTAHGRTMSELDTIATSSGVRTRTVRLDGRWWKQDLGAMVGSRREGSAPVALLPISGGYVMADQGKLTPITAQVAEGLENRATVLYRPLPLTVRSVGALLRFGLRNNGRDLRMFAVVGLVVSVLGLVVPVMTGMVLGKFVARADRDLVAQGSLVVIGAALVIAGLSVIQNIAALRIESRSAAAMQVGVWNRLLSLPASFFTRYSAGELGTTVLGITGAQELLSGMLTTATLGLLTGLANLVLVYFYSVRLALIATTLVLVGAVFALVMGYVEVRWQRRLYNYEQRMSSRVYQMLTAIPKLRVAAAEDRVFGVWAAEFARGRSLSASARRAQNAVTTFNAAFPLVGAAVLFAVVGGPMRDEVSLSAFLSFFAAFNLLLASSLQFTATAITAMGIVPMLEELRPILEAVPESNDVQAHPGDLSGRVSLSHVSFRYGPDSPFVLDDVSITVEPGEFVAVVGPSGSGKTTILRLLLGFEAPVSGTVLFDGQSLAELDVSAVRRQCGVVLQNGGLLAATVQTNIVGSSSYTVDDAWEAAEMAGVAEVIRAMPMGMSTVLSEGTSTLSGGQRQRLMIARALVSRPRILLLDEATSALDNPTQKLVAESTRKLNASRVVIAHRLSTVVDADKIVVLDKGRVVQQGRYEDLLADAGGLFARLASQQMVLRSSGAAAQQV